MYSIMKKILLTIASITAIASTSFAYNGLTAGYVNPSFYENNSDGLKFRVGVGVTQISQKSFNEAAYGTTFPQIQAGAFVLPQVGISYKSGSDRIILEFMASVTGRKQDFKNNITARQTYTNFDLSFGYIAHENLNNVFYPSISLGLMSAYLKNTGAFNIANPNGSVMNSGSEYKFNVPAAFHVDPALNYEYKFHGDNFLALGIRAGYRIGLNKATIKNKDNAKLMTAPTFDANGLFATVYARF